MFAVTNLKYQFGPGTPHHSFALLLFSNDYFQRCAIKRINQAVSELALQGDVPASTLESLSERPQLFNDYSTADMIIKLKPSNQLIYAHSSILSKSPFFEACKNFKESNGNGYIEITPPCVSTAAECIEFLYFESSDATAAPLVKLKSIIRSQNFSNVYRNAVFLQIDGIVKVCEEMYLYPLI